MTKKLICMEIPYVFKFFPFLKLLGRQSNPPPPHDAVPDLLRICEQNIMPLTHTPGISVLEIPRSLHCNLHWDWSLNLMITFHFHHSTLDISMQFIIKISIHLKNTCVLLFSLPIGHFMIELDPWIIRSSWKIYGNQHHPKRCKMTTHKHGWSHQVTVA